MVLLSMGLDLKSKVSNKVWQESLVWEFPVTYSFDWVNEPKL